MVSEQREQGRKLLQRAFDTVQVSVAIGQPLDEIVSDVRIVGEFGHLHGESIAIGMRCTIAKNKCAVIGLLKRVVNCVSATKRKSVASVIRTKGGVTAREVPFQVWPVPTRDRSQMIRSGWKPMETERK